jgi:hypothetical protein
MDRSPFVRLLIVANGMTTEKKVGEVLASLARLGYVMSDEGKTFTLRRVA